MSMLNFLNSSLFTITVGFRPVISQKTKCEFITLKHNSMNVYINWVTFRQFWVLFSSKRVKKLIIHYNIFFSNLLSKIHSYTEKLKCYVALIFMIKLGLCFALLCTKSQNLLEVWKLRQNMRVPLFPSVQFSFCFDFFQNEREGFLGITFSFALKGKSLFPSVIF